MTREVALIESRTLRSEYTDRTDVLDRVGHLATASDTGYALTAQVAAYFGTSEGAIEQIVKRNREEMQENGYRVLNGDELREFKARYTDVPSPYASQIAVFTRRSVLTLGMLMEGNEVAKALRIYLLNVEEAAGAEVRGEAIGRVHLSRAQVSMLRAAEGLVDTDWLASKAKVAIARGLGEEPEIDPADVPLYVPDFVKTKGVTKRSDIESIQSWFGRRVAALYEERHGTRPGKRTSELPNGQIRETYAWTQRDAELFEEVWEVYYAAKYAPQTELNVIDGGA